MNPTHSDLNKPMRCSRPPVGWWCSREAGHDGPCAALPKGRSYPPLTMALRIDELEAEVERLRAWANQYEAALLAVRTEAKVGRAAWLLSNDTFERVRAALEDPPEQRASDEERRDG